MRTFSMVPGAKGFKVSIKQPSRPRSAVRARIRVSDLGSNNNALAIKGLRLWLRRRSFSLASGIVSRFVTILPLYAAAIAVAKLWTLGTNLIGASDAPEPPRSAFSCLSAALEPNADSLGGDRFPTVAIYAECFTWNLTKNCCGKNAARI